MKFGLRFVVTLILPMNVQFLHHLLKRLFFPVEWFLHLCKKNIWACLCKSISGFFILFYVPFSPAVPHNLDYCSYTISLELGKLISATLLLFFRIFLFVLVPFTFYINFRISLFISTQILLVFL